MYNCVAVDIIWMIWGSSEIYSQLRLKLKIIILKKQTVQDMRCGHAWSFYLSKCLVYDTLSQNLMSKVI